MADTTKPTCLLEEWEAHRDGTMLEGDQALQARRLWYSGAMAVLALLSRGARLDSLRGETLAYARTIGTSVEKA